MIKATDTNTMPNPGDNHSSAETLAYAEALTADTRRQIAALSARASRVAGLLDVMPCAVNSEVS